MCSRLFRWGRTTQSAAGGANPLIDVGALVQALQSWGQLNQVSSMILQRLEASPLGAGTARAKRGDGAGGHQVAKAGGSRRKGTVASSSSSSAAAEQPASAADDGADMQARLAAIAPALQALDYLDALLVRRRWPRACCRHARG